MVGLGSNECQFCRTRFGSGQEYCHGCGAPCPTYNLPISDLVTNSKRQAKIADRLVDQYAEPFEKTVVRDTLRSKIDDPAYRALVETAVFALKDGDTRIDLTGIGGSASFHVEQQDNNLVLSCIKGRYTCTTGVMTRTIYSGDTLSVPYPTYFPYT